MVTEHTAPYLTEAALGRFLNERIGGEIVHDGVVPGAARKFRPDYRIVGQKVLVEFDGPDHYTKAEKILSDQKRDHLFADLGFWTIRIPFFIQLDRNVIEHLFVGLAMDTSRFLDFPQGFISKDVPCPADFCELGIDKFVADLKRFHYIRAAILKSLSEKVSERGDWRGVYPRSLYSEFGKCD